MRGRRRNGNGGEERGMNGNGGEDIHGRVGRGCVI